jgi:spore cortex formation protein SpoVR/YcgB (stage V sporulation)
LKTAWANFRDDSFIAQYLSPHLIRKLKLFKLENLAAASHYKVAAIHDERGYREVRRTLASQYDPGLLEPNIQVTSANLSGDRRLILTHRQHNRVPLAEKDAKAVLAYVADLWGFTVELRGVDDDDAAGYSYECGPATAAA